MYILPELVSRYNRIQYAIRTKYFILCRDIVVIHIYIALCCYILCTLIFLESVLIVCTFLISEPLPSSSLLQKPNHKTDPPVRESLQAGQNTPLLKPQVHMVPQYHQLAPQQRIPSPVVMLPSSRPDVTRVGSPLSSSHSGGFSPGRPPQWPAELAKMPVPSDAVDMPPNTSTFGPYRTLPNMNHNGRYRPQKHTTFNPKLQYIPYRDNSSVSGGSEASIDTVINCSLDRHRNNTQYQQDITPIRDSAV